MKYSIVNIKFSIAKIKQKIKYDDFSIVKRKKMSVHNSNRVGMPDLNAITYAF